MKGLVLLLSYIAFYNGSFAQDKLIVYGASPNIYMKHKVKAKENIYSIGRMYNISPSQYIAPLNNIKLNDILNEGQYLKVPIKNINYTQQETVSDTITKFELYYYVQPKDQLLAVAQKMSKCDPAKLRTWNALTTDVLQIGQLLKMGYLMVPNQNAWALKKEKNPNLALENTEPIKIAEALKKVEVAPTINIVDKTNTATNPPKVNDANNYFKPQYKGLSQVAKIMAIGFFNSNATNESKKYYALINLVSAGTIVKVTNPINGKTVYAQVLSGLENVVYNQGLQLRLSNNTFNALGVMQNDKVVKLEVAY